MPYRQDSLFGVFFLLALLIPLAFDVYNFESFEIIKFGLMLLLVGCCGYYFFKSGSIRLNGNKFFFCLLLFFLGWVLLASFWALDKNYAFFGFYPRFTNGFLFYFIWSGLIFMLAGRERGQLLFLLKTLFFCSGMVALWGLIQSLGWGFNNGFDASLFSRGAPSFLGNPNFSSMFVAASLPLGISFLFLEREFRFKTYYALSLFFQLWSLIIFASRGALFGLVCGLVFSLTAIFLFRGVLGKKIFFLQFVILLFGLLLGFIFFNFARPNTLKATVSLNDINIQNRLNVWHLAVTAVKERPLVGYGPGNFELVFERYRQLSLERRSFFDDPHNLLIYLAAAGGWPLLLAFLLLIGYPALAMIKRLSFLDRNQGIIGIGVFAGMVSWLVASSFNPVTIPCYMLLAFFIVYCLHASPGFSLNLSKLFAVFGKIVSVLLVVASLSFLTAEHLFFGSIRSYNSGQYNLAADLAKTALKLNPFNSLYYEYWVAGSIRAGRPEQEVALGLAKLSKFHPERGYSYVLNANLNYLRLFTSRNLAYKKVILDNLNKAIALDPYSATNYFLLGQYNIVFADLPAAESAILSGLRLEPNDFEAHILLAKIYQYQNDKDKVIETLSQAIKINPGDTSYVGLLALAKRTPDIRLLPFNLYLSVGKLD